MLPTRISKIFAILLVLDHSAMFVQCQRCYLDNSPREALHFFEAGIALVISFTCPSGFLRHNSDCILSRSTPLTSHERCPDLESLNLEYNITLCYIYDYNVYYVPTTTSTTPYHISSSTSAFHYYIEATTTRDDDTTTLLSEEQCSYPISEFLVTSTEKNKINLALRINNETKRLYVDVYTEEDVPNIREKLYCWGETGSEYIPEAIRLERYIPMNNEILISTRYILETNENITIYYCTFFHPGKQKPIISNRISTLRFGGNDYTFLVPNKIFSIVRFQCYIWTATVRFLCEAVDDRTNIMLVPSRGYSNVSEAVKYLQNIYDRELPFYDDVSRHSIVSIVSTQYCLDHNDTDNGVVWCATKIGDTTTPCENPCVDNEGNIITRRCGGDYQTGSVWLKPSSNCSANSVHSGATLSLLSDRNAIVTKDLLLNVSTIIQNTVTLTAIDVDSISRILSNAENQYDAENFQSSFFQTADSVLNINEDAFSKAFQSRENILNSIDKYLNKTAMATTNLSFTNLAVNIKRLKSSDQMLTVEHISAKFPKSIIEGSPDKDNFNVAMVVFKSTKLFYQGALASHVTSLVIPSASKYFHEPISIYFDHKSRYDDVVCGYWDYGKNKLGNWSIVGVKTIRHNGGNMVECQTNHLTSFVLLGVSEGVIKDLSLPILKYISGVGCFLSLLGTTIILFTAIAFKNWYKRRVNTLQLSCVVLLEVLMLFVADITEPTQTSCVIVGALMHYLILAKFMLMLVIAKFQYSNFVTVMQSRNTPQHNLTYTAICLIGPLIIVTITASVFPYKYNSGNLNFCYPKDEIFIYFLVLPISIILLVNIAVFSLVMIKISKSITRGAKEKNLQAKLAFLMWFMLGFTWFLGLMAEIIKIKWLQVAFVYGFCIFGPLQGFVVFWFAVIKDKDAMTFLMKTITNYKLRKPDKIEGESTISQSIALSSTIPESNKREKEETKNIIIHGIPSETGEKCFQIEKTALAIPNQKVKVKSEAEELVFVRPIDSSDNQNQPVLVGLTTGKKELMELKNTNEFEGDFIGITDGFSKEVLQKWREMKERADAARNKDKVHSDSKYDEIVVDGKIIEEEIEHNKERILNKSVREENTSDTTL